MSVARRLAAVAIPVALSAFEAPLWAAAQDALRERGGEAASSSADAEAAAAPTGEDTGSEHREQSDGAGAPESDAELRKRGVDPCVLNEKGNFIDWLNRTVTRSVCGSARWFDSFFGTSEELENRHSTFGRAGLGASWDEDDGVDPETRFYAKYSMPNLENKLQAVIGRGNAEDIVDSDEAATQAEEFFDEENEWLVGFRYNFEFGDRARLSPSLGARWSGGIDPYFRLRYIFQEPLAERTQLRLRITPQWQNSKGFGYTLRPTVDHMLAERFMLRWDISVKDFQERFEGYSYGLYMNLFQKVNTDNALRYKLGLFSQSQLEHQPQDVGLSVSWRTTVYKENFIIESTVGTTFRRRPEEPKREPKLILGLVFEIKFGR